MSSINNLLRNETKVMLLVFLLPLVAGMAAVILIPCIKEQLAIDRCLDRGGSYDYKLKKCIMAMPPDGSMARPR